MLNRILPFILMLSTSVALSQKMPQTNPLLVHSNAPIAFDKLNADIIRNAVSTVVKVSDARLKNITQSKQLNANIIRSLDELQYEIYDLLAKLQLISSTYTDDSTRESATRESEPLSLYASNLFLNEQLYKKVKTFAASAQAKQLKPNHKKYLRETIIAFEKNGMKLNAAQRKELKALNEKLVSLGLQFDKNIAESKDSVEFSEADLTGVAEATKAPWRRGQNYVVMVNGPNAIEVITNADSDETRRKMYLRYNNRAYPANIAVLDSLFFYRHKFAKKLGFSSYAAYSVVDKMAATPANVWKFEKDLMNRLQPAVAKELEELRQVKRQVHPNRPDTIYAWDASYYRKKLLDTKYQLNIDEVKEYFEMNNTLDGMFRVYEKLFALQIKPTNNVPVWHEKVNSYEIFKEGKKIGNFYLDLYPRPNKYTHFACFPISQYRKEETKEVLPVSALICNFPEGNESQPSLLYHFDVVTLFHEFGHLVHSMLGRSDISVQGPFNVKGDFVEAPSQILENWAWEYEPLKMFARHYKTGEVLPKTLYDKMYETRNVGIANQYIRQVYFGMLDFTYEDRYESIKEKGIVQVSKELNAMTQIPFAEDAHFITSFGHLSGYAANYYGYLWSKVYAEDMFSQFKKAGVMNPTVGLRYRQEILEKGSTREEMDMLRAFLGREPNTSAFLQSLGLQ